MTTTRELIDLLREARELLRDERLSKWTYVESGDMHADFAYFVLKLEKAIAKYEAEPERKCGTCIYRRFPDGVCKMFELPVNSEMGCIRWGPRA